jgi:serine protease
VKILIHSLALRVVSGGLTAILAMASGAALSANVPARTGAAVNPYSPSAEHAYRHGVVPTRETLVKMKSWAMTNTALVPGPQTLSYGGGINGVGVTSGVPKIYLIVYGAQWGTASTDVAGNMNLSGDRLGAVPYLEGMYKGLGMAGERWSGVATEYCDGPLVPIGATSCPLSAPHVGYPGFAGIWYDNAGPSPLSATQAELAQEAIKAAAHFGNTTAASNRYAQYVILSPSGTTPDGFNTPSGGGFCAWHDNTGTAGVTSPYGDIAYTNLPYVYDAGTSCGMSAVNSGTAGNLDGFSIVAGHEYANTVTDQYPSFGWINRTGSVSNGQESGDQCTWVAAGTGATAQNVAMTTGSFAMQSTWSNSTNSCNIWGPGSEGPPYCDTGIADGTPLTCATAGLAGYTGTAYSRVYTTSSAGTSYCRQLLASGYDTKACTPSNVLSKDVPVTGITEAAGASTVFTFTVPVGATSMTVRTYGGTGDSDLYLRLGSAPTTSNYLRKSDGSTTTENITITSPVAGTYYVMVSGYATSSGVSLVASYSTLSGSVLSNGVPVNEISVAAGSYKMFTLAVPAGRPGVTFKTSGGVGDSDLYVQFGSAPTTSAYLKRSNGPSTAESITITSPAAGTYYVMVYGYAAASGISLVGND